MSAHDNEDLIDYEDEHDVVPNGASASATNGAAAAGGADGDDKDKKNFSGIHSTGFRCALNLPSILARNTHGLLSAGISF